MTHLTLAFNCATRSCLRIVGVAFILFVPLIALSSAEATNWCQEAERSLTDKAGKSISCSSEAKRCVRMNNYWCQKHSSSPWKGTPKSDGKDGNSDVDGHAIFESVEWSARAIAVDLRAKYKRGLVTAVDIASAHSPWCDTLGSKAVVNGRGRTCLDGRANPPVGFSGPFCEKPKAPNPSQDECAVGCNCPPSIAKVLTGGLNLGIHDDLKLFDAAGRPQPNLVAVIRNLALQEQGIYVKSSVIKDGIAGLSH